MDACRKSEMSADGAMACSGDLMSMGVWTKFALYNLLL